MFLESHYYSSTTVGGLNPGFSTSFESWIDNLKKIRRKQSVKGSVKWRENNHEQRSRWRKRLIVFQPTGWCKRSHPSFPRVEWKSWKIVEPSWRNGTARVDTERNFKFPFVLDFRLYNVASCDQIHRRLFHCFSRSKLNFQSTKTAASTAEILVSPISYHSHDIFARFIDEIAWLV